MNKKSLLIVLLCMPLLGWSWGAEGHIITGKIAEKYMKPVTKAKLKKLLDGQTIDEVSNWLDQMRPSWDGARPYHYISMPVDALNYQPDHCNKEVCAMSMIDKYESRLLTSRESPPTKAECVKIIVHLVEDLHMPLHTGGQENDYGGNAVKVDFMGKSSNLHKIFDTNIIRYHKKTNDEWVEELTKDLDEEDIAELQAGELTDWVEESHKIVNSLYENLPKEKKDKKIIINEDYIEFGTEIIEDQLLKAGLRLAKYLDEKIAKVTLI